AYGFEQVIEDERHACVASEGDEQPRRRGSRGTSWGCDEYEHVQDASDSGLKAGRRFSNPFHDFKPSGNNWLGLPCIIDPMETMSAVAKQVLSRFPAFRQELDRALRFCAARTAMAKCWKNGSRRLRNAIFQRAG